MAAKGKGKGDMGGAPPPPPPVPTPTPAPTGAPGKPAPSMSEQLVAAKGGMAHVELAEPGPELAAAAEVPFDQLDVSEEAFQDLQLKASRPWPRPPRPAAPR